MPRLMVFNSVTLDGYFAGANGDLSWAHKGSDDPEFQAFTADNAKGGGRLLFGRKTYELMAGYWPTPAALQSNPVVAERMNSLPKIVFSRTLAEASWSNTTLLTGDLASEVRRLKQTPGEDMVIFGSGTIVSQLTPLGLIDEYQVVMVPVVLGKGKTMFDGIPKALALKLTNTRRFGNGRVFLCYEPTA